jgi:hypothetical protein
MLRVLSAPSISSTIIAADAIIGTVHVSVWFKSVERCPRSGVYFIDGFKLHRHMNCTYDCICSFNCNPDDGCRKHPKHVE